MERPQQAPTSREERERCARELVKICKFFDEGPQDEFVVENSTDYISQLLHLCSLIHGTDSLKEYVQELLVTGMLTRLPQLLLVDIEKDAFGLFNPRTAKEFERMQILIYQLIAIRIALAADEEEIAAQLYRRLDRWKKQFKILYGESAEHGISKDELARLPDFISKPFEREEESSS